MKSLFVFKFIFFASFVFCIYSNLHADEWGDKDLSSGQSIDNAWADEENEEQQDNEEQNEEEEEWENQQDNEEQSDSKQENQQVEPSEQFSEEPVELEDTDAEAMLPEEDPREASPQVIEEIFGGLSGAEVSNIRHGYRGKKFGETFSDSEWLTVIGANEDVYVIETGDTLWGLCGRLLDNSYYWPKLWQLNQYIGNPHFIYPGAELRFLPGSDVQPPSMKVVSKSEEAGIDEDEMFEEEKGEEVVQAEAEGAEAAEEVLEGSGVRKTDFVTEVESIERAEFKVNYRLSGLITEDQLSSVGTIVDAKTERTYLQILDRVQLELSVGVSPGDRLTVFKEEAEVEHPVTGNAVGYKNVFLGVILVYSTSEGIIDGRVISAFGLIKRGDTLTTHPVPYTNVQMNLSDQNISGYILCFENTYLTHVGSFQTVHVDLGAENGITPGNMFHVLRREILNKDSDIDEEDVFSEVIGTLMVLGVEKATALATVISSRRPIKVGDRIVMLTPEKAAAAKDEMSSRAARAGLSGSEEEQEDTREKTPLGEQDKLQSDRTKLERAKEKEELAQAEEELAGGEDLQQKDIEEFQQELPEEEAFAEGQEEVEDEGKQKLQDNTEEDDFEQQESEEDLEQESEDLEEEKEGSGQEKVQDASQQEKEDLDQDEEQNMNEQEQDISEENEDIAFGEDWKDQ